MSTSASDRFSLTNEQYLEKYHVLTYLEDAIGQLLEHRDDNPRVLPARFLSDYFRSVVQGNHTLFRGYSFIRSTPFNRSCFIRVFWKAFRHIGKNGDLLTAAEYHSLICLLCPDFPFEPIQKAAKIILMEDAMDCLMSFVDFLYAFEIQFYYEEFFEELHKAYQMIQAGNHRPGQVVVVPTLDRPQLKEQQSTQAKDNPQSNLTDGVDVHTFMDAALQILHTHEHIFKCPPVSVIKSILSSVERVTFYGFLMALAKHDGANESIGALPQKSSVMEEIDQDMSSANSSRPKSARAKSEWKH
ncbi:UPF0705 protein C11orf49 homolog [Actinia tenebrosa]|uniref:Centriolar satellite-associated tubulin polyglutamylase complex regulator 1 n=1 Tax=Actinia tenebrosa TaxID=6105 RepID=A0A6P8H0P8_ACTTE|nr:UPF0705 protein C11orf49 homolog [Actinia tenebrosa]